MKKLLALLPLLFLLSCSHAPAVSLTWDTNPSEQLVTVYKVYRLKGNSATLVTTVTSPPASVDHYLSGNRTTFYVRAVNSAGEGPPSSKVTVQTH